MKLEGLHHITAITGDAPRNVDFYAGTLGLRMVKKTVNQDDPTVYHLFYGDEHGSPGADLTFFEYPGAVRGRAGAGMVHRIVWRVASPEAHRLLGGAAGRRGHGDPAHATTACASPTPRDSTTSWSSACTATSRLAAEHPDIPAELALQGFDGVRAYSASPDRSTGLLEDALGLPPRRRGLGAARRRPRVDVRLRRAAGRVGDPRRGHRPPRGVGVADRRAVRLADRASSKAAPGRPI